MMDMDQPMLMGTNGVSGRSLICRRLKCRVGSWTRPPHVDVARDQRITERYLVAEDFQRFVKRANSAWWSRCSEHVVSGNRPNTEHVQGEQPKNGTKPQGEGGRRRALLLNLIERLDLVVHSDKVARRSPRREIEMSLWTPDSWL